MKPFATVTFPDRNGGVTIRVDHITAIVAEDDGRTTVWTMFGMHFEVAEPATFAVMRWHETADKLVQLMARQ